MSTTKVTDLTELTSAADDDVLLISDVDAALSKKIQKSNITEQNFTTTLKSKLDGIEASADVTDATNVDAAGAVMESDTTTASMSFVVDEDDMTSDSATKVPTQQSVKAYVDSQVQSKDALSELSGTLDDIADGTTYVKSTNDYTDAEQTKLSGIETGATADQTAQEIATAIDADATAETTLKSALGLGTAAYTASTDYATAAQGALADSAVQTETDPVVGAISGIVKANGAGTISAAVAGTDYLTPTGDGSGLTGIDALPSQTGQSGNYLTTDGSTASWAALDTDANTTTKGLYEHAHTISANYSITSGNNAMSAGPVTVDTGYSVTVPSGSVWTIV